MPERRMFAKTIIDSDAFLDMPLSTQALYFHLCMRADDEGFVNNPKKIQRMIGASDDDGKVLIAKRFIIPFESGVVVIKHWKIHNYIQKDRFKETVYQEERSLLEVKDNGAYKLDTECLQDVSKMDTQVRLGKVSIDKDNINNVQSEFEPLWKLYPRKQGKDKAYKAFQKALKEGVAVSTIETGLMNYLNYIEGSKIEPKYIKMGSTWFNNHCWNDDYTIQPSRKGSYFQPTAQYMDYKTYEANAVEVDDDIEDFNFGGNTNVNGH